MAECLHWRYHSVIRDQGDSSMAAALSETALTNTEQPNLEQVRQNKKQRSTMCAN